ncbi:MAG: DEAD/DEAH box helicase, partial [Nanoarchaeota archaeon]|nr:DEAD/DEAH box helicase [Nanoarchaeota archaeon]
MIQNFRDFNLHEDIIKGLDKINFSIPTQIQEKAMPLVLEGEDLVGLAQTGTGKTATFSLPILQKLLISEKETKAQHPRALILAPTRELCLQIGKNLKDYAHFTGLKSLVTHGGVSSEPQIEALKGKVDILVATPGRLVDLVEQKNVFLDDVETLVLDEADHIIEMGLRVDLKKILKAMPKERQTLLFSATMNKELKDASKEIFKPNPGS